MLLPMDRLAAEYGVHPKGVLHVGAHLGEEAAAYHAAGVRRVLWIEGNPRLLARLTEHVTQFSGQRAVGATISDLDGDERMLYLATFSMSSSLFPFKEHLRFYPSIVTEHDEPVVTTTIDTLLRREGVKPSTFDMANLDIEGAELLALRGMTTVLPHLKWLYMEVNFEEMQEGCARLPDVDAFLEARGFVRVALQDTERGWGDALYVREHSG